MTAVIEEMTIEQYDQIYALWQITSRRALSGADQKKEIERYLKRNKGLSQVALHGNAVVGTVLAGHDGRRGYIHHLAVLPKYRRKGIAKQMVSKALKKLEKEGIHKTHIFTYQDNKNGQGFWQSLEFTKRDDLFVYSLIVD